MLRKIFVDENISEAQNGLRGLPEDRLEQFLSNVRDAEKNVRIRQLVCVVCEILEQLCLENCGKQPTTEIISWGANVWQFRPCWAFWSIFFQHHQQGIRLHKRLELFSMRTKDIMSDQSDTADEVFMRDFFQCGHWVLIHFCQVQSHQRWWDFELTGPSNSPVTRDSEKQ